jgi:TonB family protein
MKSFILISAVLLASGCAASRTNFPARRSEAAIPAADRLATDIHREHHGLVTSKVKMCVASDGAVDSVDLMSSSGMAAYDDAVIAAVSSWEYEAPGAPSCQKLNVSYRTP